MSAADAEFAMDRFVAACVAEYGANAPLVLRSGRAAAPRSEAAAPRSELHKRVRGEYAVSFVDGEFDFTVEEMVSGTFASFERNLQSPNIQLVQNALCTPLAASDMLDMCVLEIETMMTRVVIRTVIAAILSTDRSTNLACLPDALLVRIGDLAMADLRLAREDYKNRRRIAQYELESMIGGLSVS
jgi:hypothetical protein